MTKQSGAMLIQTSRPMDWTTWFLSNLLRDCGVRAIRTDWCAEAEDLDNAKALIRSKPLRVALDVDGVLALPYDVMIAEWNDETGSNFTIEDATEHDEFHTNIGMRLGDFLRLYNYVWTDRWEEIRPTVAEHELKELMDHYEVDLVTNRPQETVEPLKRWLSMHFPGTEFNIMVAGTKAKFDLPYDVYIDDGNPLADMFVNDSGRSGKRLVLVDAPYNRGKGYENHEAIVRADGLLSAIAMLVRETMPVGPPVVQKAREKS